MRLSLIVKAFIVWQGIIISARHKTVSFFLIQRKYMISLFHPDDVQTLTLRMGTLEMAKDSFVRSLCIFEKEILET